MTLKITFLGAAGTVTGSKYALDNGSHTLLIDCGLFQGFKALRLRNWESLPIDLVASALCSSPMRIWTTPATCRC